MKITHEEYGAKAANLAAIAPLIAELDASDTVGIVGIPDFVPVSIGTYERWMHRDIEGAEIYELFKQAKMLAQNGEGVMVRSSAVLSEDGPAAMGAGIYETVRLDQGFTSRDFFNALKYVYESVNSPKAVAYMEQLGINPDNERMGIILQTRPKDLTTHFVFDSRLAGVPQLALARTEDLSIPEDVVEQGELISARVGTVVLDREKLANLARISYTGWMYDFDDIFHMLPDDRKFKAPHSTIALGKVSLAIEDFTKVGVQVEAVEANLPRFDDERDMYTRLWIVQQRQLAANFDSRKYFGGFPEDITRLVFIGRGSGVVDGVTAHLITDEKLPNPDDIAKLPEGEAYLMAFFGSFAKKDRADRLAGSITRLPPDSRQKLIIMVEEYTGHTSWSINQGGHLETMCLELGIPCVFYSEGLPEEAFTSTSVRQLKRVRVYSNGYESRIFNGE